MGYSLVTFWFAFFFLIVIAASQIVAPVVEEELKSTRSGQP